MPTMQDVYLFVIYHLTRPYRQEVITTIPPIIILVEQSLSYLIWDQPPTTSLQNMDYNLRPKKRLIVNTHKNTFSCNNAIQICWLGLDTLCKLDNNIKICNWLDQKPYQRDYTTQYYFQLYIANEFNYAATDSNIAPYHHYELYKQTRLVQCGGVCWG